VLSIDEKSQIQALDRTQPGLPMKKGRCGIMTHEYETNQSPKPFVWTARPQRLIAAVQRGKHVIESIH
jgi:hypothetical protein